MSVEAKFQGYSFYDNEGGFDLADTDRLFVLADHLPEDRKGLEAVVDYAERNIDAVWVLGRLIEELDVDPVPAEERSPGTMMEFSIQADPEDGKGVLFGCNDEAGSARLCFAADVPEEHAAKIAATFFGLLLDKHTQLSDYRARLENVESGVLFHYGVAKGKLFYDEDKLGGGGDSDDSDDFDIGGLSEVGWGEDDEFGDDDDEDDEDDW